MKLLLWMMLVAHCLLPFCLGIYAIWLDNFIVAIAGFIISAIGFMKVYEIERSKERKRKKFKKCELNEIKKQLSEDLPTIRSRARFDSEGKFSLN